MSLVMSPGLLFSPRPPPRPLHAQAHHLLTLSDLQLRQGRTNFWGFHPARIKSPRQSPPTYDLQLKGRCVSRHRLASLADLKPWVVGPEDSVVVFKRNWTKSWTEPQSPHCRHASPPDWWPEMLSTTAAGRGLPVALPGNPKSWFSKVLLILQQLPKHCPMVSVLAGHC